ncbi:MAG TPA: hypothetical protein EYN69_00905 [Flavobacteriales bacterium]|nr:hypothetical protein [Flavobacteriales bacterium]
MNFIKIHIKSILLCTFLLVSGNLVHAQLYPVPLAQRVSNAQVIIEGIVISHVSFWDDQHHNIYTSNIIEVYKVFKGSLSAAKVEIITEGGKVGNEMQTVTHSLKLKIGDVGIFTCNANNINKADDTINQGYASFRTYADLQGFLVYDITKMSATDPFNSYSDVKTNLYPAITGLTNEQVRTIKEVNLYQKAK